MTRSTGSGDRQLVHDVRILSRFPWPAGEQPHWSGSRKSTQISRVRIPGQAFLRGWGFITLEPIRFAWLVRHTWSTGYCVCPKEEVSQLLLVRLGRRSDVSVIIKKKKKRVVFHDSRSVYRPEPLRYFIDRTKLGCNLFLEALIKSRTTFDRQIEHYLLGLVRGWAGFITKSEAADLRIFKNREDL